MILYIPIELENRELHSKILLASHALKKGFKVILGKKNQLNRFIKHMPPGVYYGLGAFKNFEVFYSYLNKKKFNIVVCEEEGLVTYKEDMYIDMRVSKDTLQYINRIYTWGDHHRDILNNKFVKFKNRFVVTGNPRFDLINEKYNKIYKNEISYIKNKYKKIFLVCTSFSSVNHFQKNIDYIQSLIEKKTIRNKETKERFIKYQNLKKKTLESYVKLIPIIAEKNPDIDFIIRPHPSENHDLYLSLEKKHKNIFVETRFSVHPWIKCSIGILHHYCTTAIEALALNIPRFSFRPIIDKNCEYDFPFECSYVSSNKTSFVNNLNLFFKKKFRPKDNTCYTDYSKYALNIFEIKACNIILDDIQSNLKIEKVSNIIYKLRLYISIYYYYFVKFIQKFSLNINNDYSIHKFHSFDQSKIQKLLSIFISEFSVDIKIISNDIVLLEKIKNHE